MKRLIIFTLFFILIFAQSQIFGNSNSSTTQASDQAANNNANTQSLQVAPDVVLKPSSSEQALITQLFDSSVVYKKFHRNKFVVFFPIPTLKDEH